jgi:hypothetical protein
MGWILELFEGMDLPTDVSEKLVTVESGFAEIESEKVALKLRVDSLNAELAAMEAENQELRKTRPLVQGDVLDKPRLAILRLLNESTSELTKAQIETAIYARGQSLRAGELEYHLDYLSGPRNFISWTIEKQNAAHYFITSVGRAYLFDNNLG